MGKKHPAIITIEDFVFYVIFTSVGGYGYHSQRHMRKFSRRHLVGKTIKNGRFKQTEWCSISDSDFGMAEIKYTGILTYEGIKLDAEEYLSPPLHRAHKVYSRQAVLWRSRYLCVYPRYVF